MIRSFAAILIFGAALAVAQHSHSAFAQSIDGPPQSAAVEDMAVFEPYIGRFRSEDKTSDEGPSFFYEIDYRWYDRGHTIVSYALILVVPSQDRRVGIGDGYYYVDRINGRIGVFGVFPDGRPGLGALGEFDRVTGARTVWVTGVGPNGVRTQVRDHFEIIDGNTWRNATHIRQGDDDWRQIGSDIYTRLSDNES